ncbi:MAG: alpha/beta fold hydrolase [Anaerolineales bacterium]|nr:alpha/beta fold hydrolase [Anaerolineales bacterium]
MISTLLSKPRHCCTAALITVLLVLVLGVGRNAWVRAASDPTAAQTQAWNMELVGHTGGSSQAVATDGTYTYLNEGRVLTVLNTRDPQHPQLIGRTVHLPMEYVVDLELTPGLVCVLGYVWNSGFPVTVLSLVDVSDAAHPQPIAVYETDGSPYSLAVQAGFAYLGLSSGLQIVDVRTPAAPVQAGFYAQQGVYRVAVQGAYAYLDAGWFYILNISDPANPQQVGYLGSGVGQFQVAGSYLYSMAGGLTVIDLSDPSNPVWYSNCSLSIQPSALVLGNGLAYLAGTDGLAIVDISDPANPGEIGLLAEGLQSDAIAYAAGFVVVPVEGDQTLKPAIKMIDVSNPAAPQLLSTYHKPEYAYGLTLGADYTYLCTSYGLNIIAIANPALPREIGSYNLPGFCHDVALNGQYAYVADGWAGLRILDVSDPDGMIEVGHYSFISYSFHQVIVRPPYAYLADSDTLVIIDISDPQNPTFVGNYNTANSLNGIALRDDYIYMATGSHLVVMDISNPAVPVSVNRLSLPATAFRIALSGELAYLTASGPDLLIVNLANPAQPELLGQSDLPGGADAVAVADNLAYIVDQDFGLRVVDIADPASPFQIGYYQLGQSEYSYAVATRAGLVYFTGLNGLDITRFAPQSGLTITGRVTDAALNPIAGVQVAASGLVTATTDSQGYYSLTQLINGTYTLTPAHPSYQFTPPVQVVQVPPDAAGVDFTAAWVRRPVIVLPGMGASLNFDCFLYGNSCEQQSAWGWFDLGVQVADWYQPLIGALQGAGYSPDDGYLRIFFYDWRKPLEWNAARLADFIQQVRQQTGASQVELIGHSMGGLVARAYVQSFSYPGDVAHLVTLGSPHQGAAVAYPIWEGGDPYHVSLDPFFDPYLNTLSILFFKAKLDWATVPFIRTHISGTQDLLPTQDYLYASANDSLIPEASMQQRNNYLAHLNRLRASLLEQTDVTTIAGTGYTTPARYYVWPHQWWMGVNWEDGQPDWNRETEFLSSQGDNTVLAESALLAGAHQAQFVTTHGGLTGDSGAIDAVLAALGAPVEAAAQPLQGAAPVTNAPLLILALNGAAQLTVTDPGGQTLGPAGGTIPGAEYLSHPGDPFQLILIPDPQEGGFSLQVTGQGSGDYQFGLLNAFDPLADRHGLLSHWDLATSRIEAGRLVSFALTYTQVTSPTMRLLAETPLIETPLWADRPQVNGRGLPGQVVEILEVDSGLPVGSASCDAQGRFQVLLTSPLQPGQWLQPWMNGVPGVAVPVKSFEIYLALALR